jgi:hypothetical protein
LVFSYTVVLFSMITASAGSVPILGLIGEQITYRQPKGFSNLFNALMSKIIVFQIIA